MTAAIGGGEQGLGGKVEESLCVCVCVCGLGITLCGDYLVTCRTCTVVIRVR